MSWRLVFTKQGLRDAKKVAGAGLGPRVGQLLDVLRKDPYSAPPPVEKLVGDLAGALSRRINYQHRLVYQVLDGIRTVKVLRMWSHYE